MIVERGGGGETGGLDPGEAQPLFGGTTPAMRRGGGPPGLEQPGQNSGEFSDDELAETALTGQSFNDLALESDLYSFFEASATCQRICGLPVCKSRERLTELVPDHRAVLRASLPQLKHAQAASASSGALLTRTLQGRIRPRARLKPEKTSPASTPCGLCGRCPAVSPEAAAVPKRIADQRSALDGVTHQNRSHQRAVTSVLPLQRLEILGGFHQLVTPGSGGISRASTLSFLDT